MATDKKRVPDAASLRPVEFEILLSLAAGERHGYGIILDIESRDEAAVPDISAVPGTGAAPGRPGPDRCIVAPAGARCG